MEGQKRVVAGLGDVLVAMAQAVDAHAHVEVERGVDPGQHVGYLAGGLLHDIRLIGDQDREVVGPKVAKDQARLDGLPAGGADLGQHLVATVVAIDLVYQLELVDVPAYQQEGLVLVSLQVVVGGGAEALGVEEAGLWVHLAGLVDGVGHHLLGGVDQLHHERQHDRHVHAAEEEDQGKDDAAACAPERGKVAHEEEDEQAKACLAPGHEARVLLQDAARPAHELPVPMDVDHHQARPAGYEGFVDDDVHGWHATSPGILGEH